MKLRKHIIIIMTLVIGVLCSCPEMSMAKKSNGNKSATSQASARNRKKGNPKSVPVKAKTPVRKSVAKPVEVPQSDSLTMAVNRAVINWIPAAYNPGGLRVNSVKTDAQSRTTKVGLNENFTYLPITAPYIDSLKMIVAKAMPDSLQDYHVALNVGSHALAYYINKIDKLPEKYRSNPVFIKSTDAWSNYSKGMNNDNIALWHSHGRYFRQSANAWLWQRPVLFETLEDIYTMGYVLPYLVPMLENAGANVMLPRERDTNRHEVIVDNDINEDGELYSQPYYREQSGSKKWSTGEGEGFIYDLKDWRDTENPFENGTYREVQTVTGKSTKPSVAAWYADIPADGEYAVYVSYKTLPNSTTDARYTVNYSGGSKEFIVNQTMGGGTWIYLGTFPLKAGYSDKEAVVTLTNESSHKGDYVVTADAVKIGGGMGNVARSLRRSDIYYDPSTPETGVAENNETADDDSADDETDDGSIDEETPAQNEEKPKTGKAPVFKTSGLPRYLEGARYWLHWAGFPESVYSPFHGSDDYKDDYTSRGHWVNYLAGGSRVLPKKEGLNIPVDLSMALHSDAGKRDNDSFVGTLGIYYSHDGANYADGTPRINSRMLTDLLMRQITSDIRQEYEPKWTRRSMWDKSYLEARVAEVPTSLIELMSHQNYADMMYGLDPNFRFTVGRSIYKGMARFLAERKGRELVIQPLPVKNFMIAREHGKGEYKLSWEPTPDSLEPTAMPNRYIILERSEGDLGFHKVGETGNKHFTVKVTDNKIHSFKVVASNDGGLSFDSEVLALRNAPVGGEQVLVINGFDRVSAPAHYSSGGKAGFDSENDFGVPYIKDVSFSGHQQNFSKSSGNSFGVSASNYIDKIIAGNTFDYPSVHGRSIANAGSGFVSASAGAVEAGHVKLSDYKVVDLILGKQKATTVGNGHSGVKYITFPPALAKTLSAYVSKGGNLMVTGQYVGSDAYESQREFITDILGVVPSRNDNRPSTPRVEPTASASGYGFGKRNYTYNDKLTEEIYIVENPDVLTPVEGSAAEVVMTMSDSGQPAAVINKSGKGKVFVMSIPFETIRGDQQRDALMKDVLNILK